MYSVCLQKCLEHLFRRINHLFLPFVRCPLQPASLSTATSCALVVAKFDLFLQSTQSTRSIHSLSIPDTVAGRRTPNSSAKLLQTSLVIVIFATSQDLIVLLQILPPLCFFFFFQSKLCPQLPTALTAPESRPATLACSSAARQHSPKLTWKDKCRRTALPLIDTRSRQLDRRAPSPSEPSLVPSLRRLPYEPIPGPHLIIPPTTGPRLELPERRFI